MNKKYTIWSMVAVVLIAIATMTTGCKKEKNASDEQKAPEGMLCFNNAEEFAETYKKVVAMTEEERRAWEQQQGFKSYATKCNELLDGISSNNNFAEADVIDFVKSNPMYFVINDNNGNKIVSCRMNYSPYKYLVDENGIVRIGDEYIKAFDEGVAIVAANMYDKILDIESYNSNFCSEFIEYVPSSTYVFSDSCYQQECKSGDWFDILCNNNSGKSIRANRTSWKEGNRNTIQLVYQHIYLVDQYFTEVFVYDFPEHRVSGIWFPCARRKNFNVMVNYLYQGISKQKTVSAVDDGGYSTREELEFEPGYYSVIFSRFRGTAYTYDTPTMKNFDSNKTNFGLF